MAIPSWVRLMALGGLLVVGGLRSAGGQPSSSADRYDQTFRKYSKRFFGPFHDWRIFKAQAMAESNLRSNARSQVGARGLMQLMPSTFKEVKSKFPDVRNIDDPEWNIAAGIYYDRTLWKLWEKDTVESDLRDFTFASYNAGRLTIRNAQSTAAANRLDHRRWKSIEQVAPQVSRWRHRETLEYVHKIGNNLNALDDKGRLKSPKEREMLPPGKARLRIRVKG